STECLPATRKNYVISQETRNMKNQNDAWTKRFDFFALAGWLGLGLGLAAISFLRYGMDFRGYYAAARVLVSGGNPYDYHQVAPVLLRITGEMGNNPYYYPPWFTWIFIPLIVLPFQLARMVWMAFNVGIWNLSLWKLGKILQWPPEGWRRYFLYVLATFLFARITWKYEQAGILVFSLLIAIIVAAESKQWIWFGCWMALLLIKPNITLIVVTGLSLWLIRKHQWQPILVMMLSLGILLAISTWITPDWYKPFFDEGFGRGLTAVLDGPDKVIALRISTTFIDWLKTLGVARQWLAPMYAMAVITGSIVFFIAIWYSRSFLQVLSISLLVSFALTPYAMQYDNPSLVIVVFWALSICSSSRKGIQVGALLAAFIFSVIFWQKNISWGYWIVLGSIVLAIWAVLLVPRETLQDTVP
ncbi:MAG: glycosyltransferase family 87 protein, partial [Chloroflexota bacterium]|nr:glycosyltransferase family 87 protein [Anaerolineales bacterium]